MITVDAGSGLSARATRKLLAPALQDLCTVFFELVAKSASVAFQSLFVRFLSFVQTDREKRPSVSLLNSGHCCAMERAADDLIA